MRRMRWQRQAGMTDAKRLRQIRRRCYRGDRLGVTDTPVQSLSTHSSIAHLTPASTVAINTTIAPAYHGYGNTHSPYSEWPRQRPVAKPPNVPSMIPRYTTTMAELVPHGICCFPYSRASIGARFSSGCLFSHRKLEPDSDCE